MQNISFTSFNVEYSLEHNKYKSYTPYKKIIIYLSEHKINICAKNRQT